MEPPTRRPGRPPAPARADGGQASACQEYLARAQNVTAQLQLQLVEALAAWTRQHDGSLPRQNSSDPYEASLRRWIIRDIGSKCRSGNLDNELREELAKIPAVVALLRHWDDARARVEQLEAWVHEKGGSLPRRSSSDPKEVSLAYWIERLAGKHRRGKMEGGCGFQG